MYSYGTFHTPSNSRTELQERGTAILSKSGSRSYSVLYSQQMTSPCSINSIEKCVTPTPNNRVEYKPQLRKKPTPYAYRNPAIHRQIFLPTPYTSPISGLSKTALSASKSPLLCSSPRRRQTTHIQIHHDNAPSILGVNEDIPVGDIAMAHARLVHLHHSTRRSAADADVPLLRACGDGGERDQR
jgi:hypothetical protein